jgi:hypothetical protein
MVVLAAAALEAAIRYHTAGNERVLHSPPGSKPLFLSRPRRPSMCTSLLPPPKPTHVDFDIMLGAGFGVTVRGARLP